MKKINLFLIVLLFLSPTLNAREVPVEYFFKFSKADNLVLSPTGKYYTVVADVLGGRQLFVIDRESKKVLDKFSFPQKNEAGSVQWISDDRFVVSMNRRVGALDQSRPTGFYFASNADGSKKVQLWPPSAKRAGATRGSTPKGFRILDTLDSEPKKILVQMYNGDRAGIYTINTFTGRHRLVEAAPFKNGSLVVDNNNNAKVFFRRNEDDWDLLEVFLKNESGEWNLFKKINAKKGGLSPVSFSEDNKKMFVYHDSNESPKGIYSLDLSSNKLDLVYQVKGDADIQRYIFEHKYKNPQLVGIAREPGFPVVELFDSKSDKAKLQSAFEAAFPDKYVSIGQPTKDGNLSLVRVFNDKNPGEFYLYDAAAGKTTFEMASRPWLKENLMATKEPISFKARDGLEIRGYLTLPKSKKSNLPMVVVVHGGPYGPRDSWAFDAEAQFLANRGYAVLQVNFRGSGGRGRDFQYGAYRKMGKEMQDDLTDATLWAIKKGVADKDRICIYGASYGAYAALMGTIKEPDLYKCAIGYAGAYDIAVQRDESDTATVEAGRKFLDEAWNAYDEKFVKERSPVYHVNKIKAELLLVHGDADARTPIEGFDKLTKNLDEIGKSYESLVKPNEGHGFYDRENTYEFYKLLEAFLKKHIGVKTSVDIIKQN